MAIEFHKYHGTGNDFILIDDRQERIDITVSQAVFSAWCDRHTGIGADGIILLRNAGNGGPEAGNGDHEAGSAGLEMVFFNADGRPGSMCGNGARCFTAFADTLNLIGPQFSFLAPDGTHEAGIAGRNGQLWDVWVRLKDVLRPVQVPGQKEALTYYAHTGSPHLVVFAEGVEEMDVFHEGRRIRNLPEYREKGINVNFAEIREQGTLFVRTYERGVENETLSCGTGVTSAAISYMQLYPDMEIRIVRIVTRGGELRVSFTPPGPAGDTYSDVSLRGPARLVFSGRI